MRKKDVVAILLGTLCGVIAMLCIGFSDEWADTPWHVPFLWLEDGVPPLVFKLQLQAILLRTCHLILEHGSVFIAAAILISLAFSRWSLELPEQLGERICLRAMWLFLCLETMTFVLGCLGGFVAEPSRSNFHQLTTTTGSWGFVAVSLGMMTAILPVAAVVSSIVVEWMAGKRYRCCMSDESN